MIDLLRRLLRGNGISAPAGRSSRPSIPDLPARMVHPRRPDAALEVVGESYRQEALARLGGPRTEDGPTNVDHVATLVREPGNRYDPNAVAVVVGGLHVGYLSRGDAELWNPVVSWAEGQGFLMTAQAALIGGWDRGPRDRGSYGIVLHLGTPSEAFVGLLLDSLEFRADHPWPSHLIAFTGDSVFRLNGFPLDRDACTLLARHAGLEVHPRVTKKVQLLIDCDQSGVSGNEAKASQYGIPVVSEVDFWAALGVPVERIAWQEGVSRPSQPWAQRSQS